MADQSLQEQLDALPHGREFRFVDTLLTLEPGQSGTGRYTVRGDEPFLPGHFPGQPILPGVILAEAIAQLAGIVGQSDPEAPRLENLRLTALRNVKILGAATPGQTLDIAAKVAGRMGGLIQAEGTIDIAGERLCSAVVTLSGDQPSSSAK